MARLYQQLLERGEQMKQPTVAERILRTIGAFRGGYRTHMIYPATSRLDAIRMGLSRAHNYLHNTSRRWPGCNCEMHRKDGHRWSPYDNA